jgi:hypothetical protein
MNSAPTHDDVIKALILLIVHYGKDGKLSLTRDELMGHLQAFGNSRYFISCNTDEKGTVTWSVVQETAEPAAGE